jgi:hypothetical protein
MPAYYFIPHLTTGTGQLNLAIRTDPGPLSDEMIRQGLIDAVDKFYPDGLIVCLKWDGFEICEIDEKEYREIYELEYPNLA